MHSDEFRTFLKAVLPGMGFNWRRFERRNIRRKVRLRMEAVGIREADKYGELVASDPDERAILGTLLRVTITRFFRNGWLWEELARQITHYALGDDRFAVWSAGCAGGEEPFSMAMILDDLAEERGRSLEWGVTGSDVDPPSLERARNASYQWGAVREVPPKLLERWFRRDGDEWYLDERVRQRVTIGSHDILKEEPPGRFNVSIAPKFGTHLQHGTCSKRGAGADKGVSLPTGAAGHRKDGATTGGCRVGKSQRVYL